MVSGSGGASVLASDAVAAAPGLDVATPTAATREALATMVAYPLATAMIDFGGFHRPLVLEDMVRAIDLLAADRAVGALLFVMTP